MNLVFLKSRKNLLSATNFSSFFIALEARWLASDWITATRFGLNVVLEQIMFGKWPLKRCRLQICKLWSALGRSFVAWGCDDWIIDKFFKANVFDLKQTATWLKWSGLILGDLIWALSIACELASKHKIIDFWEDGGRLVLRGMLRWMRWMLWSWEGLLCLLWLR